MNEGVAPRLRALNVLSESPNGQILSHMENFPTPKLAMVPLVANLLTLVFLAGTTWWSSAQRPLAHDSAALLSAPRVAQAANMPTQLPVDNTVQAARASTSPAISGEGIISVGFSGTSLR